MGRKLINGKDVVITPRNGRNWCDVVNSEPLPVEEKSKPVHLKTISAEEYKEIRHIFNGGSAQTKN